MAWAPALGSSTLLGDLGEPCPSLELPCSLVVEALLSKGGRFPTWSHLVALWSLIGVGSWGKILPRWKDGKLKS